MTSQPTKSIKQLKTTQVKQVLDKLVIRQGGKCAVCKRPFSTRDRPVLDHDHETGFIRGVLHNSCNGVEGKLLVVARRGHAGVPAKELLVLLGEYLEYHKKPRIQFLHPSHKNAEELRLERNRKQRMNRAYRNKKKVK